MRRILSYLKQNDQKDTKLLKSHKLIDIYLKRVRRLTQASVHRLRYKANRAGCGYKTPSPSLRRKKGWGRPERA